VEIFAVLAQVSIHAPRVGRDEQPDRVLRVADGFNSRAPRGARRTCSRWDSGDSMFQFTRPAWGATVFRRDRPAGKREFQFTRPAWGATHSTATHYAGTSFQFTRPAWGATRVKNNFSWGGCFNSRAPRGARQGRGATPLPLRGFNSRAPRGARQFGVNVFCIFVLFQFTRPAWGATPARPAPTPARCFNSRAPRGARQGGRHVDQAHTCFNSRAPRGARPEVAGIFETSETFQFTRPAWGATSAGVRLPACRPVSIHAPRVGRDSAAPRSAGSKASFNSRAPRGARQRVRADLGAPLRFNSRAPRGARRSRPKA